MWLLLFDCLLWGCARQSISSFGFFAWIVGKRCLPSGFLSDSLKMIFKRSRTPSSSSSSSRIAFGIASDKHRITIAVVNWLNRKFRKREREKERILETWNTHLRSLINPVLEDLTERRNGLVEKSATIPSSFLPIVPGTYFVFRSRGIYLQDHYNAMIIQQRSWLRTSFKVFIMRSIFWGEQFMNWEWTLL